MRMKKKKHEKIDFSPTYYMLNSSEKNSKELIDANISYEEFELVANETWNIINWKKLLKMKSQWGDLEKKLTEDSRTMGTANF